MVVNPAKRGKQNETRRNVKRDLNESPQVKIENNGDLHDIVCNHPRMTHRT